MAFKKVSEEESFFPVGVFRGMWIFSINFRSAYDTYSTLYSKCAVQCETCSRLGPSILWSWSYLGLPLGVLAYNTTSYTGKTLYTVQLW